MYVTNLIEYLFIGISLKIDHILLVALSILSFTFFSILIFSLTSLIIFACTFHPILVLFTLFLYISPCSCTFHPILLPFTQCLYISPYSCTFHPILVHFIQFLYISLSSCIFHPVLVYNNNRFLTRYILVNSCFEIIVLYISYFHTLLISTHSLFPHTPYYYLLLLITPHTSHSITYNPTYCSHSLLQNLKFTVGII